MPSSTALRDFLRAAPARREALILAAALLFGLFIVPFIIWLAGSLTLGPYAGGGPGALEAAFLRALGAGSPAFWGVAIGPYLLVLLLRLLAAAARRSRRAGGRSA